MIHQQRFLEAVTCLLAAMGGWNDAQASIFHKAPGVAEISNAKVFEEPLIALEAPSQEEQASLAKALEAYVEAGKLSVLQPLQAHVKVFPKGAWNLALQVNLGLMHRHVGQTSEALKVWEQAWKEGKDVKTSQGRALTHRALGELLEAYSGLGMKDPLAQLLREAKGRPLSGLVTEKVSMAREALAYMEDSPKTAFRCGPVALAYLKALADPLAFADPRVENMLSTEKGTSLAMNSQWAESLGLKLQMIKRAPGSPVPVPSVVHFKTGHFAALTYAKPGKYLLQDPFLGDVWMSLATLDAESSGYALAAAGPLSAGWAAVAEQEGASVYGKGAWGPGRPDDTRPDSHKMSSSLFPAIAGAPKLAFHSSLVSLNIVLPVVDYAPIRGPKVEFKATYNQREYGQPQWFDYCNLGHKWTFSYLACLKDDTTNPDANVTVCNPGGGGMIFQSSGEGTFKPENHTQARLTRRPDNTYMIEYLDGRRECYDMADRAWGLRRIVLTHVQDKFGNEVRLTWDPLLRLRSIKDAAGQMTTLDYELPHDPLKLTRVTDPFGKATSFDFDGEGRLVGSTGKFGNFKFAYGPVTSDGKEPLDFLHQMAGPEGGWDFRGGEDLVGPSYRRWIEAKGPDGKREYLEGGAGYTYEIPPSELPRVPEINPAYHPLTFNFRECFFWDAKAASEKLDYQKARHIQWGRGPGGFASGIVLTERQLHEPRRWYVHAGDFWGGVFPAAQSPLNPLTQDGRLKVGKMLAGLKGTPGMADRLAPVYDGNRNLVTREYWQDAGKAMQIQRDFNPQGRLLREIDASGAVAKYTWEEGTGNLLRAQLPGGGGDHRFQYDARHRLRVWQKGKQKCTASYTASGLLKRWTRGKDTWTFHYDKSGLVSSASSQGSQWLFTFGEGNRLLAINFSQKERRIPICAVAVKKALSLEKLPALPKGIEPALEGVFSGPNGQAFRSLLLK